MSGGTGTLARLLPVALALALIGGAGMMAVDLGAQGGAPCERPLSYRITELDPRHDIDRRELEREVAEAAALWEDAAGRSLFRPVRGEADLEIRLVYGEVQAHLQRQRARREELERDQDRHRDRWETFRERVEQLERRRERHEQEVAEHERRQERLAERVERWNRGEIERTPQARERLESEQEALQREAASINERAEALQDRAAELERRQEELLAEQEALRERVERFNRGAERLQGFQAGQYERQGRTGRITVYQFRDRAELRTILAHELGHALGIEHVEGRRSVMYPTMSAANRDPDGLSRQDRAALREVCPQ